jgi:hypothetical protein
MTTLLVAAVLAVAPVGHAQAHRNCEKTFSRPMITRAIDTVYRGTKDVSKKNRADLRKYLRCARRHVNRTRMHRYWRDARKAWDLRRNPPPPPMSGAIASYYTTEGTGACGFGTVQTGYRFASLILPCGAIVRFCRGSVCINGEMADHGPYIAGRTFDFNYNMKNALGCGGICYVTWRRLS